MDVVYFTTTIVAAAKDSFTREAKKLKTVTRWTRELELEIRRVRKLRRKLNIRLVAERDKEKTWYRAAKNRYFTMVIQEK